MINQFVNECHRGNFSCRPEMINNAISLYGIECDTKKSTRLRF